MSKNERRRRTRVPVQKRIKHSKYQVLGTPVFQENSSLDFSSSGVSFETIQEYQKGTLVLLEVEIDHQMIKLLVCVAWVKNAPKVAGIAASEQKRYQVGAELIAIDPEHKKLLQNHVGKLIRAHEQPIRDLKKKTTKKKAAKKKLVKKKMTKKKVSKKKTAKKKKR